MLNSALSPGYRIKSLGPVAAIVVLSTVKIVVQVALLPASSVAVTVIVCEPTPTSVSAAGD